MIPLKHRVIHWFFRLLSLVPDIRRVSFLFYLITHYRAIVLGWQDNKTVGTNVQIWQGCHIPASAKINLGAGCIIKEKVSISGTVTIGAGTLILAHSKLDGCGGIQIGSETHIGRYNVIFTHNHDISRRDIPVLQASEIFQPVYIGSDVMLYSRVTILPGVSIGDGAAVGYGSIVSGNLEAYGIYAGVPARLIGGRI